MGGVWGKISVLASLAVVSIAGGCAEAPNSTATQADAVAAADPGTPGVAQGGPAQSPSSNLLRLGSDIEAKGSVATALPIYEHAAAEPSAGPEVFVALGDAYAKLNRDHEAADAYRKALTKDANNAQALLGLGSIMIRSSQVETGLDMIAKAAPLVNTAEAYDRLGVAHIMAGQPREALASFEQAYSMNRTDPDIATNVALAAALLGQHSRAVSLAEHTLTYAGIKPYHRRNLILALAISGKPNDAKAAAAGTLDERDVDELLKRADAIRQLANPKDRAFALGMIKLAAASKQ